MSDLKYLERLKRDDRLTDVLSENPADYLCGSAGCLVMICPQCGAEHFRDRFNVLIARNQEYCVDCNTVHLKLVKAKTA